MRITVRETEHGAEDLRYAESLCSSIICRELVRHMKSTGLPEPPATANQLARIRELQLPLDTAAAATLTAAEARAMLFKAQLVEEQAAAAAAKKAAERTGRARKSRKPRELR